MLGFKQCCDAVYYMDAGQICLQRGWPSCWFEYRAIGSTLLNAVMYPAGLAPLNHLLLVATAAMFARFDRTVHPLRDARAFAFRVLGAWVALEFVFMGVASVNLTDVPAGVFAAMSIVAFFRRDAVAFAVAAAASVLIRAAYFYPMLLMVLYFLAESVWAKDWRRAVAAPLYFACLAPQYVATYQHLGVFSFLDPSKVDYWRNFHLSSNLAGYDTLLPPAALRWPSGVSLGLSEALQHGAWWDLMRLMAARLDFYFGSFVPLGKVYLGSADERVYSVAIYAMHAMLFACSILYLRRAAGARAFRIVVPVAMIVGQSLIIIPEQRFIFVLHLFLFMFTYLYFLAAIVAEPRRAVA